jgi:hypothetical protein
MLCNDQAMLNETLSDAEYMHYSVGYRDSFPMCDGAIIIIPARHCLEDINHLNQQIARHRWVVVMLVGDEESLFPIDGLKHPNMRIWVMSPVRGKHTPPRFLINGSQPQLHEILAQTSREKKYDWFFAGQVTHSRRRECVEQLRKMPNGFLLETAGFMQGMPYADYLANMAASKFVICPSGPVEQSTARIGEALEAGCVPIVDGRVPLENLCDYRRSHIEPGYWEWFFGEQPPFFVIYDWATLPALVHDLLPAWDALSVGCAIQWREYKNQFKQRISDDVRELNG